MTIGNDLAKICKKLLWSQPFFGNFLLGLNKSERTDIPTAGVSRNGIGVQLVINPDFWRGLKNEAQKMFLLHHELLHIALQHLSLRDSFSDKELFNIAADLVINQLCDKEGIIEGSMTLELFKTQYKIDLEPNQDTKYYYNKLLQEEQQNPKGQFAQDRAKGAFGGMHGTWIEWDKLSETEKKLIQKQVEYQIKEMVKNSQKMRGLVPSYLKEYVDSLFEKVEPVLDWKAYLRRFMGSSSEVYTKKTRRKQSNRFPENPGLKIKQKKRILVGVDTSGSMSQEDLKEAFNEIYHIYRTGTAVDVMEIDATVHRVYPYKGKWDQTCSGRGGTQMSPGIEYFNEHSSMYSTFVLVTDGFIESDPIPVRSGKRMLWVVSSNGQVSDTWPGYKIQIKR